MCEQGVEEHGVARQQRCNHQAALVKQAGVGRARVVSAVQVHQALRRDEPRQASP